MISDTSIKYGIIILLAAALAAGGYVKGKSDARVEVLKDTIIALDKRKEIDGNVQNLPAYEQCLALGGLPDECDELRGMDRAAEGQ